MLITLLRLGSERLFFSPEQTFTACDLDSARMSAFGQKQPWRSYATAESGHSDERAGEVQRLSLGVHETWARSKAEIEVRYSKIG